MLMFLLVNWVLVSTPGCLGFIGDAILPGVYRVVKLQIFFNFRPLGR